MNDFNKCVSIISPCYNGEKYVGGFLNSVLNQTYPNIELIFIDDASTDSTEEIVKSYIDKFAGKGYSLVYHRQNDNKGQAAAINVGLKQFSGTYVAWMDSDDVYYPNAIEDRVVFLQKNPQLDFVLTQGEIVNEEDIHTRKGLLRRVKPENNDNLFKDLLDEKNVVFCPGTILVRTDSLRKSIPNLSIYESREGQNWQLMLPLAYKCKYGYINEVQFKYVVHNDSHSHVKRTYDQSIKRRYNFYVLLKETISNIPGMTNQEMSFWISYVYDRMLYSQCIIAMQYYKLADYYMKRKELISRGFDVTQHKELSLHHFLANRLVARIRYLIRRFGSVLKRVFQKL